MNESPFNFTYLHVDRLSHSCRPLAVASNASPAQNLLLLPQPSQTSGTSSLSLCICSFLFARFSVAGRNSRFVTLDVDQLIFTRAPRASASVRCPDDAKVLPVGRCRCRCRCRYGRLCSVNGDGGNVSEFCFGVVFIRSREW